MKIVKIRVTDMDCAMCARSIENAFVDQTGIISASVNLSEGYARIKYDELIWNEDKLAMRIRQSGYTPMAFEHKKTINWQLIRLLASIVLSLPLLWTMIAHAGLPDALVEALVPPFLMHPFTQWALATPVQFVIGASFYRRAYYNIKQKTIGMDVLVALATTIAYFYSVYEIFRHLDHVLMSGHYDGLLYFEASSVIITVILIGHYLEHKVKLRTSRSLQELMELASKEALVLIDGKEILKPIDMIQAGALLRVKKGEKIPLDGVIETGKTVIDESMITGESVPVSRDRGQAVIGATLNMGATITMRVTNEMGTSMLAKIIQAVEEAQQQKPRIQRIADIISSIFVPTVVVIASVAFLVHMLWLNPGQFDPAFSAAIAVLVISCPCALGLATPMSIMVGSSLAARSGILFKNGTIFEKTPKITAIAFDKTGTLTKGQPQVTDVLGSEFDILASMELASSHPLSFSIREEAKQRGLSLINSLLVDEEAGAGLTSNHNGHVYRAGSVSFISQHAKINQEQSRQIDDFHGQGKTTVLLAQDSHVVTIVAIKDVIKDSAATAIRKLQQQGVTTYLVSGDHPQVALSLAQEVGIPQDCVKAGMTPFGKADFIKSLKESGHKVAFVGDGINDAIALQEADLSLAMGTGSSVAIETSDVTLLYSDLDAIVHTLTISKAVLKNIKLGFFWAFSYNLFAIPIAFMGLLSPVVAAAAMVVSDVTVVLNALRLYRLKLKK
ncbi:MAG TPA: heavy metal translocating P-type ATPase [Bacilli bacterium]|nr:heavy metal translocating P-type ATPase [Bacilli bacterium]